MSNNDRQNKLAAIRNQIGLLGNLVNDADQHDESFSIDATSVIYDILVGICELIDDRERPSGDFTFQAQSDAQDHLEQPPF